MLLTTYYAHNPTKIIYIVICYFYSYSLLNFRIPPFFPFAEAPLPPVRRVGDLGQRPAGGSSGTAAAKSTASGKLPAHDAQVRGDTASIAAAKRALPLPQQLFIPEDPTDGGVGADNKASKSGDNDGSASAGGNTEGDDENTDPNLSLDLIDLDEMDPFTAEKVLEQREAAKQAELDAGAFSANAGSSQNGAGFGSWTPSDDYDDDTGLNTDGAAQESIENSELLGDKDGSSGKITSGTGTGTSQEEEQQEDQEERQKQEHKRSLTYPPGARPHSTSDVADRYGTARVNKKPDVQFDKDLRNTYFDEEDGDAEQGAAAETEDSENGDEEILSSISEEEDFPGESEDLEVPHDDEKDDDLDGSSHHRRIDPGTESGKISPRLTTSSSMSIDKSLGVATAAVASKTATAGAKGGSNAAGKEKTGGSSAQNEEEEEEKEDEGATHATSSTTQKQQQQQPPIKGVTSKQADASTIKSGTLPSSPASLPGGAQAKTSAKKGADVTTATTSTTASGGEARNRLSASSGGGVLPGRGGEEFLGTPRTTAPGGGKASGKVASASSTSSVASKASSAVGAPALKKVSGGSASTGDIKSASTKSLGGGGGGGGDVLPGGEKSIARSEKLEILQSAGGTLRSKGNLKGGVSSEGSLRRVPSLENGLQTNNEVKGSAVDGRSTWKMGGKEDSDITGGKKDDYKERVDRSKTLPLADKDFGKSSSSKMVTKGSSGEVAKKSSGSRRSLSSSSLSSSSHSQQQQQQSGEGRQRRKKDP